MLNFLGQGGNSTTQGGGPGERVVFGPSEGVVPPCSPLCQHMLDGFIILTGEHLKSRVESRKVNRNAAWGADFVKKS